MRRMDGPGSGATTRTIRANLINPHSVFLARSTPDVGGSRRSFRFALATALAEDAATLRWNETPSQQRSADELDLVEAVRRLVEEPNRTEPDVAEALVIGRVIRSGQIKLLVVVLPIKHEPSLNAPLPIRLELRLIRANQQSGGTGPWADLARSSHAAISVALSRARSQTQRPEFQWPSVRLGEGTADSLELVVSRLSGISALRAKGVTRLAALRTAFGLPALVLPAAPGVQVAASAAVQGGTVPAGAGAAAAAGVAGLLGRVPALRFDFPSSLPWEEFAGMPLWNALVAASLAHQPVAGNGNCMFNAFAWFMNGSAVLALAFKQLLSDILRRADINATYPSLDAELAAQGHATATEHAAEVLQDGYWGSFVDAKVLCRELRWGLAVFAASDLAAGATITHVQAPQSVPAGGVVIALLHSPGHWDLLRGEMR